VLCVDEKTSPQPRTRKAKTLPPEPGKPMRVEGEYLRKGALNLFAAFDTRSGKVYHSTAERKRQVDFIVLLDKLEREIDPAVTTIHFVLDNLRMHKGKLVQAWLAQHPRFQFHHPPVHVHLNVEKVKRYGIQAASGMVLSQLASAFSNDLRDQRKGWAWIFHSRTNASSRSARACLSAKLAIPNRLRWRMLNHCST